MNPINPDCNNVNNCLDERVIYIINVQLCIQRNPDRTVHSKIVRFSVFPKLSCISYVSVKLQCINVPNCNRT